MGRFFEPEGIDQEDVTVPKPGIFTQEFISSVVKKSISDGDIDINDRLTFIGIVDESGAKAIIAVSLVNKEIFQVKFNGVFEHEWTGDNKAGAKVIFSVK